MITKEKILQAFYDIDAMYNDSSKYDSLSMMLDELIKEKQAEINRLRAEKAKAIAEIKRRIKSADALIGQCSGKAFIVGLRQGFVISKDILQGMAYIKEKGADKK